MAATWTELFPPSPSLTEKDFPSQEGRVFLITGGSSGIGFELAKQLYNLNGRVYITSRSESSAQSAVSKITKTIESPIAFGSVHYLILNLSDLSNIKSAVEDFLEKEKRLDVLYHNAGMMIPTNPEETTVQGYHQQLGVNVLAPFLLQKLLTPLILSTSSLPKTTPFSTRVIFVSSSAHRAAPLPDGINWEDINLSNTPKKGLKKEVEKYAQSKAMDIMLAYEFAHRHGSSEKILALSVHPGMLSTGLQKNAPRWYNAVFGLLRKEAKLGALTELWAGLVGLEKGEEKGYWEGGRNGAYVLPWGRWGDGSKDVFRGLVEKGNGEKLWNICDELVEEFL